MLITKKKKNTGQGPPEWNRQTGTMAELGALEAMAVQGAQEAMVELGALEAMAELGALEAMAELGAGSSGGHGGAGSSGGHGGVGSSGGHGRWSSGALASVPSARPLQPELLLPPQKFPWGSEGVSGTPSRARQTGQDSPQEQEALQGYLGG